MRLRVALLSALLPSLLIACDGSGDTKLGDLSDSEIRSLCERAVELDSVEASNGCGRDTPDAEALAACIDEFEHWPSSCQATLDQAEECLDAQAEDPCGDVEVPACEALDACED
jgi:hypothetical protein